MKTQIILARQAFSNNEEAEKLLKEAVSILRIEFHNSLEFMVALAVLGDTYQRVGNGERAINLLEKFRGIVAEEARKTKGIFTAVEDNNLFRVAKILETQEKKIKIVDASDETLLYGAIRHRSENIIGLLMMYGASVNISNNYGITPCRGYIPLHYAVEKGHLNAVKSFMQEGANPLI